MNAEDLTRGGLRILVFFDSAQGVPDEASLARVKSAAWPGGRKPELIDVQQGREEAEWYGIVRVPAVAIVDDGMLVAIEHDCSAQACRRVVGLARRRSSQLRGRRM